MENLYDIRLAALLAGAVAEIRSAAELLTGEHAVRDVEAKNPTDFVTNVDRAVQSRLKERLAAIAPDIQFMAEEQDNAGIDPARPFWLLDPVDGTTNLIRGLRHSAVSLALVLGGELALGIVCNPFANEVFTAMRGAGAYLNGEPIHVTKVGSLARSLVSVGTAPGHREWADRVFSEMRALFDGSLDVRRSGCASLDLCDVACGRIDAYIERYLLPWDYAAGALIVSEAGGRAENCAGQPLSLTRSDSLLASNSALHGALLELLK